MYHYRLTSFLFCLFCAPLWPLYAAERAVLVYSGEKTLLTSFGSFNSTTCKANDVINIRVIVPPRRGRIDMDVNTRPFNAGACGQIQTRARNIYYTSEQDFYGSDYIELEFYTADDWTREKKDVQTDAINIYIR